MSIDALNLGWCKWKLRNRPQLHEHFRASTTHTLKPPAQTLSRCLMRIRLGITWSLHEHNTSVANASCADFENFSQLTDWLLRGTAWLLKERSVCCLRGHFCIHWVILCWKIVSRTSNDPLCGFSVHYLQAVNWLKSERTAWTWHRQLCFLRFDGPLMIRWS